MATNSNRRSASGKDPPKKPRKTLQLRKPRPDLPLSIHKGTGYWCKKVKGWVYYFGKVADDPKGKAALGLWLEQKDELLASESCKDRGPTRAGAVSFRIVPSLSRYGTIVTGLPPPRCRFVLGPTRAGRGVAAGSGG